MTWLMEVLKICVEEQVQIKYSVNKHLILLKILKYDGCKSGIASVVCTFLDKTSSTTHKGTVIDSDVVSNNQRPLEVATQKLPEELHKRIIRKF